VRPCDRQVAGDLVPARWHVHDPTISSALHLVNRSLDRSSVICGAIANGTVVLHVDHLAQLVLHGLGDGAADTRGPADQVCATGRCEGRQCGCNRGGISAVQVVHGPDLDIHRGLQDHLVHACAQPHRRLATGVQNDRVRVGSATTIVGVACQRGGRSSGVCVQLATRQGRTVRIEELEFGLGCDVGCHSSPTEYMAKVALGQVVVVKELPAPISRRST